jgi:hypothetical protein
MSKDAAVREDGAHPANATARRPADESNEMRQELVSARCTAGETREGERETPRVVVWPRNAYTANASPRECPRARVARTGADGVGPVALEQPATRRRAVPRV